MKRRVEIVGAMGQGCYADGIDEHGHQFSVTYYRPSEQLERVAATDLSDGGWIVDKRQLANHPNAFKLVWNSPMVSLKAASTCPKPSDTMAAGLHGTFQAIAAYKLAKPDWQGLDYVGLESYLAYWQRNGARIGQRQGNSVHWTNGTITELPEPFPNGT